MHRLAKILVAVDFTPGSREALDYAVFLAERFEAGVEVVHVHLPPDYVGDVPVTLPGERPQALGDYIKSHAQADLDALLEARGDTVQLSGRLVAGRVEQELVRIATEESFDLIVMGTHGRSGLSHFLLGSVAEQVVRHAPCPVVTLRTESDEGDAAS
jgi:nucleotide-binding universal stress UspA family protein